jgi:hypothetical protein
MVAFMEEAEGQELMPLPELALKASLSSATFLLPPVNFSYSSKVHHGTTNHN